MRPARIGERLVQIMPECLEVNNPTIGLELIAKVAQPLEPIINSEEPRCSPPLKSPIAANGRMESQTRRNCEVYRSVQLLIDRTAAKHRSFSMAAQQ